MLAAYPTDRAESGSLAGSAWVDLCDPTDAERAAFETAFGLRVPTRDELSEIEATSRLQVDNGVLTMTAPLVYAADDTPWISAPTGFVLSKQVFLTVRYAKFVAFGTVIKELGHSASLAPAVAYVGFLRSWLIGSLICWRRPATILTTLPT